jgi:pantetheine-phosphate adenylyltransferase
MAHMNRQLRPGIETVFLVAGPEEFFISSSAVKEVACFGGDVSGFVPAVVADRLRERMKNS